jgi:DNA-binding protein Fis
MEVREVVMDNLKKAEQIAKDKVEEIKKSAEAKVIEAKKGAESTEAAKVEKTEGSRPTLEEVEKQAENDARILSAKEEELSDGDKTRKAELVKAKEDKLTPDEKLKRTQEATQKRIDEVISELKAERAERQQDKEKIAELETQLKSLSEPKVKEDKASRIKEAADQRVSKYLEEDKGKPREQRREMSKEEIEEWLLDDMVEAQEWLTERNLRRREERTLIEQSIDEEPRKKADEFVNSQQESLKKLVAKYPSVMPTPERLSQLRGKTKEEIDDILASENEDYRIMLEIVRSNPKKYLASVDGPEQVMVEMDKRKGSKKTITLTEEEMNQRIKEAAVAEAQRIAALDEGITSSGGKKVDKTEKKSEFRLKQEEIARKAGISSEALDSAIKRRETIGVMATNAEDFNKD